MINTYTSKLTNKTQLTNDIYLFHFDLINPSQMDFIPGQYIILSVPQGANQSVRRLYSIASPSTQNNSIELLVKIVEGGVATTYLKNLNVGDTITFQGPAGVFKLKESPNDKVFMVTGTGLAPARSIIKSQFQVPDSKFKIHLFWGQPYLNEVCLLDELKQMAETNPNFTFKICLSRETNLDMIKEEDRKYFTLGRINIGCNEYLKECYGEITNKPIDKLDFYICGDRIVTDSLKQYLHELGAPPENIVFEKF